MWKYNNKIPHFETRILEMQNMKSFREKIAYFEGKL